jgi:hypothetical protein
MEWEVRFTDEFGEWWDGLTAGERESVNASVILLQKLGPNLGFPHSSGVARSRYSHMRELRIQHAGKPYKQEKRNDTKLQGTAAKDGARVARQKRGKGHRDAKGHGPR